jgi:hypothetical protein
VEILQELGDGALLSRLYQGLKSLSDAFDVLESRSSQR